MNKRKVCIVTGTRAEYGLLYWLIKGVQDDDSLGLQLIVTGMHLSPEFGLTYKEILDHGFRIDKKVEMLLSADTPSSISKSIGLGLIGFSNALEELSPDIVVLLGDRFEILSCAIAATMARIPIAHFHGGESTEGLIDEPIRHSITKMSHLHFTAAEEYRARVIQLGENPKFVFNVGGVGIDNIYNLRLLNRTELETQLNFDLDKNNLLVTFHPVTLENNSAENQFSELLLALEFFSDAKIIFTLPNADTEGRRIFQLINKFVKNDIKNRIAFTSLGQLKYLSLMKYVGCVIGNSSSGLIEASSFKVATVNIGDRQRGRLKADSVIDCSPDKTSIRESIQKALSLDFRKILENVQNPYGTGGASMQALKIIKSANLENIIKKEFFNIKVSL